MRIRGAIRLFCIQVHYRNTGRKGKATNDGGEEGRKGAKKGKGWEATLRKKSKMEKKGKMGKDGRTGKKLAKRKEVQDGNRSKRCKKGGHHGIWEQHGKWEQHGEKRGKIGKRRMRWEKGR
jgi:hypothetical protein